MTPRAEAPFLILLDVDSTLIENEAVELLAEAAGSLDEVARLTDLAMAGALDFEASLRARVGTLKDLPVSVFAEVSAKIELTRGARRLVAEAHTAGCVVAVVSGGFHELLDPIAADLDLDHWRANRLEVVDGVLTGSLVGPIIDAAAKREALVEWAAEHSVPHARVVVVGDGANDLAMMDAGGLSVAFDAKPLVRAQADVIVDRRDLGSVLALVGLSG
ncbi:phosphoserine phosphatase SerB [Planctomonas psychrotolerans]|uniref:phosphoserine phosphatase SerB n=1 Tax=Planctomonas psychrotolerans TaxID=2528712 RepID=UPI00123A3E98|nr:phosphoserine phosphatase SerB [Planctomonas psychrotolerans]